MTAVPLDDALDDALAPFALPDLDQLDHPTGDPSPDQADPRFALDTPAACDWALRKLARIEHDVAANETLAALEGDRIHAWLTDQRTRADKHANFFRSLLANYHRRALDDDPKAKTLRFPAGELTARRTPDTIDITDADTFRDWAETADHLDLLRIRIEPDKPAIKKYTQPAANLDIESDAPAVTGDGVHVPGVTWQAGELRFTAKPTPPDGAAT